MTVPVTKKLVSLLAAVSRGGAEATIPDLFDFFELPTTESTLAKVMILKGQLASLGISLVPDLDHGELGTTRRVQFVESTPIPENQVRADLIRREAVDLELKSSMLFDHKRAANDPHASAVDLRSESVLHSCLKTLAAFLTSGGGVLYVGVNDDGLVVGIEYDFKCMTDKPERQNADGWQLMLRDFVKTKFKDGDSVNDYLDCRMHEIDGRIIARLEVASRSRLSFLKGKEGFMLFRRQGNRTDQVQIDQVEEFIEGRRRSV